MLVKAWTKHGSHQTEHCHGRNLNFLNSKSYYKTLCNFSSPVDLVSVEKWNQQLIFSHLLANILAVLHISDLQNTSLKAKIQIVLLTDVVIPIHSLRGAEWICKFDYTLKNTELISKNQYIWQKRPEVSKCLLLSRLFLSWKIKNVFCSKHMSSICLKENICLHSPNCSDSKNSYHEKLITSWYTIIRDYMDPHHFIVNNYFILQFLLI